jgi:protocatechuate 3,4-dioxygenase beta subunit
MRCCLQLCLLSAVGFGGYTFAQDPAGKPESAVLAVPKAEARTGQIGGTVLCDDTHKPARGAKVSLSGGAADPDRHDVVHRETLTDNEGHYNFNSLASGHYRITVNLPGYIGYRHEDPSPDAPRATDGSTATKISNTDTVTLRPVERLVHNLILERGAALSGRVYFSDGTPAINMHIYLETIATSGATNKPPLNAEPNIVRISGSQNRVTDDRGYFRITSIPAGVYRVVGVPVVQGFDAVQNFDWSGLSIYSGNTYHRDAAKTYELRAGEEIGDIEIEVPLDLYKVAGNAMSSDGRSPNVGTVTLTQSSDTSMHAVTHLLRDGSFAFNGVPPGTYKLTLSAARIGKPNTQQMEYSTDDVDIPISAFAEVTQVVIVKNSDVTDIHLDAVEIPIPPEDTSDTP